ncbi:MAG: hypothetical protein JJE49_06990 [Peptostreptococcaceae bacterium]|nr:hypothetical protein [Peptostreptococcaceae bacterium]
MKKKNIKRIKRIGITAAILILAAVVIILFLENKVEKEGHYTPSYAKQNIEAIVGDGINEDEYKELFLQTGLGKSSIDSIIKNDKDFIVELEKYQNDFFAENKYVCNRITIITGEEKSADAEGNIEGKFEIQGLKDGDILISLSTHSLGWRHGHAAIVVDSSKGTTLESLVLGRDSEYQNYKKWERYPSFIQLRIREDVLGQVGGDRQEVEKRLRNTAETKLIGVPYGLFAGIPVKYVENVSNTHCAHLVWYAYKELGIDIDSDKGIFVTPYDMANSDLLEIVQIYGIDPTDYLGDFN